ncbi:hypothetical protein SLS55_002214 [Diplodia seriata]|uniref:CAF1-domain-containing protein n=1 Tax=Diplodia seriata TaxID=420778 RepID=A0ABR3CSG5_9PEZI
MDVDKTAFWGRLLEILEAVSTAQFVSFDLELSGIPSRGTSGTKQTLEERYQEIKDAADRYQILQIGLTCVEQDIQSESYVVRPYNFNLNPLLEERLDIERIWSFQSGAAEFLLSVGFKMDLPMTKGVPYLSRYEAKRAKKLAYARWDKSAIADVQLKEHEVQSLEFVSKVRCAINTWKETGKPFANHLNIVSTNPAGIQPTYAELGNFEKRLVHQLVRAEYPDLVTISKPQAIQIARFDRARLALQRRRPVLVGHNLFTDIVYLYRTFIGPLPPTLEECRKVLHENFPLVVDTKYVATHNCGDINPRSSLEEIHHKLRDQNKPVIVTHGAHDKYHIATPFHEAGYDSFLTALIMIRLSTKLEQDGAYLKDASLAVSDDESYDTAPETLPDRSDSSPFPPSNQGIATLDGEAELVTPAITPNVNGDQTALAQAVAPLEDTDTARNKKTARKKKGKGGQAGGETKSTLMFSSTNLFAQLATADTESEDEQDAELVPEEPRNGSPTEETEDAQVATYQWDGTTYYSYPDEGAAQQGATVNREAMEPMTLMPPFETDFWRVYGNKLRVFGTTESVWNLRP